MAVFTLETDYSSEMGYPFVNSRQIVKGLCTIITWKEGGGGGELEGGAGVVGLKI